MAKPSRKKQNEMVAEEVERLNEIFEELPKKQKDAAKELINRVAFMTIQLQVMEDTIKLKGPTYTFKNGKQQMLIENPAQKAYNTTMNRYTAAYNILFNMLEKMTDEDDDGGFKEV